MSHLYKRVSLYFSLLLFISSNASLHMMVETKFGSPHPTRNSLQKTDIFPWFLLMLFVITFVLSSYLFFFFFLSSQDKLTWIVVAFLNGNLSLISYSRMEIQGPFCKNFQKTSNELFWQSLIFFFFFKLVSGPPSLNPIYPNSYSDNLIFLMWPMQFFCLLKIFISLLDNLV